MLGGLRTRAGTARVEKTSRVSVLVPAPVRSSCNPQPSRAAAVAGPVGRLTKSQVICQVRDSRGMHNISEKAELTSSSKEFITTSSAKERHPTTAAYLQIICLLAQL